MGGYKMVLICNMSCILHVLKIPLGIILPLPICTFRGVISKNQQAPGMEQHSHENHLTVYMGEPLKTFANMQSFQTIKQTKKH